MKHLFFWQNVPSPHQASLIKNLAQSNQVRVTVVAQENLPGWRLESGWSEPDFGQATVLLNPGEKEFRGLLDHADSQTVHIFSGTRGYPMVWRALQQALHTEARIGLYSEASVWAGLKGLLRLFRGRLDRTRFGHKIDFILAIGHLGAQWFRKCGYVEKQLYPFGYFVELPVLSSTAHRPNCVADADFQIVFIGQCIHRKGVDILLQALRYLSHFSWKLSIIGDGVKRAELQQLSQTLGLNGRVSFMGNMPNDLALQQLSRADLLVLPSRWDGWGAVVNEALMCGVPVVCSSLCGAADLLRNAACGSVFEAGSVTDLRRQLAHWLAKGPLTPERSAHIKDWAKNIQGEAAADYLLRVLAHVEGRIAERPVPPWLTTATATRTDAHFR